MQWTQEEVVPGAYVAFSAVVADIQFANLGVVLVTIVAEVAGIVGLPEVVRDQNNETMAMAARGKAGTVTAESLRVTGVDAGVVTERVYDSDDLGEVVERKDVPTKERRQLEIEQNHSLSTEKANARHSDEQEAAQRIPGLHHGTQEATSKETNATRIPSKRTTPALDIPSIAVEQPRDLVKASVRTSARPTSTTDKPQTLNHAIPTTEAAATSRQHRRSPGPSQAPQPPIRSNILPTSTEDKDTKKRKDPNPSKDISKSEKKKKKPSTDNTKEKTNGRKPLRKDKKTKTTTKTSNAVGDIFANFGFGGFS